MSLILDDFDYPLPPERIAQAPLAERSASRLLVMMDGTYADRCFVDLPDLLSFRYPSTRPVSTRGVA
jgi:S-adenosylmethionine:tRNA ribosyltransferase-isomerase